MENIVASPPFENDFDQHSFLSTGWRGVLFDDHVEGVQHHLLCLFVASIEVFSSESFCVGGFSFLETFDRYLHLVHRKLWDMFSLILVISAFGRAKVFTTTIILLFFFVQAVMRLWRISASIFDSFFWTPVRIQLTVKCCECACSSFSRRFDFIFSVSHV